MISDKISPNLLFAFQQFDGPFDIEVRFYNVCHYDSFTKQEIINLSRWDNVSYLMFDPRIKDRRWRKR
jgi:hypothetical protein